MFCAYFSIFRCPGEITFAEARILKRKYRQLNKKVLLAVEIEADISYRSERLENLNRRLK